MKLKTFLVPISSVAIVTTCSISSASKLSNTSVKQMNKEKITKQTAMPLFGSSNNQTADEKSFVDNSDKLIVPGDASVLLGTRTENKKMRWSDISSKKLVVGKTHRGSSYVTGWGSRGRNVRTYKTYERFNPIISISWNEKNDDEVNVCWEKTSDKSGSEQVPFFNQDSNKKTDIYDGNIVPKINQKDKSTNYKTTFVDVNISKNFSPYSNHEFSYYKEERPYYEFLNLSENTFDVNSCTRTLYETRPRGRSSANFYYYTKDIEFTVRKRVSYYYKNKYMFDNKYLAFADLKNLTNSLQKFLKNTEFIEDFSYNNDKFSNQKIEEQNKEYFINLYSDTGGKSLDEGHNNLINSYKNTKTNKEKLNKIFSKNYSKTIDKFTYKYKYIYKIVNKNHIDIFPKLIEIRDADNNDILKKLLSLNELNNFDPWFEKHFHIWERRKNWNNFFADINAMSQARIKCFKNLKVNLLKSDIWKEFERNNNVFSKLKVKYSKVNLGDSIFDIQDKINKGSKIEDFIKDDIPEEIKNNPADNSYKDDPAKWKGRYRVHGAIDVEFLANEKETELILINDEKVPVLNRIFEKNLIDERIKIEDIDKNSNQNSQKKKKPVNEYKVEIKQFMDNTNNSREKQTNLIIYEIVDQPLSQTIKYYAWDPNNNHDQLLSISPTLKDKNGNVIYDENGEPVLNEKYDPEINPKTGTKQEVVWITNKMLNENLKKHLYNIYPNISQTERYDFGLYANSSVLGKGALRNLEVDEEISDINYMRVKLFDKKDDKYIKIENQKIEDLPKQNSNSEFSYMSDEGIWLVFARTPVEITNCELVLIDENSKPNNFFLDMVENKLYENESKKLDDAYNYFQPFLWGNNWITDTFLIYFKDYLKLQEENFINLSYKEVINHYKKYITWLSRIDTNSKLINTNEEYRNLFDQIIWDEPFDLNGYTYIDGVSTTEKIDDYYKYVQEKVEDYIKKHLKKCPILNKEGITENKGWKIKEWSLQETKKRWLKKALNVKLKTDSDFDEYKGIKFTLSGDGKFSNLEKILYIKNTAYHVYFPPIDLSGLQIQNNFEIDVGRNHSTNNNEVQRIIKEKLYSLIQEELDKVQDTTKKPIILNQDVKIQNESAKLISLVHGNKLKDGVWIRLIPMNANLHNSIVLKIVNIAEPNKFNLDLLNQLFLESPIVISETNPENIKKEIINKVNNICKTVGIKYKKNYLIHYINTHFYILDLVLDLDVLNLEENKKIKKIYDETIQKIFSENNIIEHNGQQIEVPLEIKVEKLKAKFREVIEKTKIEIYKKNYNENKEYKVRHKIFVIVPKKDVEGFAYVPVLNNIDKDYNALADKNWIDGLIKDKDNKDIHGENLDPEKTSKAEIKRKVALYLPVALGITLLLVLAVYLTRRYLKTKGFKAGATRAKKTKTKQKYPIRIYKEQKLDWEKNPITLEEAEKILK